ncbi:MAG: DUF393 domain-containing protein [Bacteroidetes bacterium]|nr:MAG: DUF393 domain-containing protein [Bacteroidota bacterium]
MTHEWKEASGPLLFYDGHCALCNGAVSFILKRDVRVQFKMAPLQGVTAQSFLNKHPELAGLDSLILLHKGKVYTQSDAALHCASIIGKGWQLTKIFYLIPRGFRNWVYDGIAKVRYRWFGKYEACPLPPPEWRSQFLP